MQSLDHLIKSMLIKREDTIVYEDSKLLAYFIVNQGWPSSKAVFFLDPLGHKSSVLFILMCSNGL